MNNEEKIKRFDPNAFLATGKERRLIFLSLRHDYIEQTRELVANAKAEKDYHRAEHLLYKAAYAMKQASTVDRELKWMERCKNVAK